MAEDLGRLNDLAYPRGWIPYLEKSHMLREAIEILKYLWSQLDPCQVDYQDSMIRP